MKRSWLKRLEGYRVVVHTRDDQSLRGVVTKGAHDSLVLAGAEHLEKASAESVAGDVVVGESNISFVQRFGEG